MPTIQMKPTEPLPPSPPPPPAAPPTAAGADPALSLVRRLPPVVTAAVTYRRSRLAAPTLTAWAEVRSGVLLVYATRAAAVTGGAPPLLLLPLDAEATVARRGSGGEKSGGGSGDGGRSLRVSHPEAGAAILTFPSADAARHWQGVLAAAVGQRGRCLADYELMASVGAGSSGTVWAAVERATGEAVAIKEVRKADAYASDGSLRHVLDERLVAELVAGGSPSLLQLLAAFQTPRSFYLVSEWCGGGDLRTALRQRGPTGRLSVSEGVSVLSQLAAAVSYLHRLGVIHRDIKPENVLLATPPPPSGDLSATPVRLADLGLAKQLPAGPTGRATSFCGTDEYMAPEMVARRPYGLSVDWWSYGVLAYRVLVGRPPWAAATSAVGGHRDYVARERLQSEIVGGPVVVVPPDMESEAAELLAGLLCRDPARRWGEAELRSCAYFRGVDWERLAEAPPPHAIPSSLPPLSTVSGVTVPRQVAVVATAAGSAASTAGDGLPDRRLSSPVHGLDRDTTGEGPLPPRRGGLRRRAKGFLGGALGVGSGMTRAPSATSIVGYSFLADGGRGGLAAVGTDGSSGGMDGGTGSS
ncbi:hypothetical protein MMPV_000319 [Pyropia vietnamensis]